MKMRIWNPTALLLICCIFSAIGEARSCRCGRAVNEQIVYIAPVEGGSPNPRVVNVVSENGRQVIRIHTQILQGKKIVDVLLMSIDNGMTWDSDGRYEWVLRAFSNPLYIYAYLREGHIFSRSSDGGSHWTRPAYWIGGNAKREFVRKVSNRADAELQARITAIHPKDPATVYATFYVWVYSNRKDGEVEKTYDIPGMYVSHDAGDHWSLFSLLVGNVSDSADASPTLGISPSNPNIMMAQAATGIVRSSDGGGTWSPVGQQAELNIPAEIEGHAETLTEMKKKDSGFQPPRPGWLNLYARAIVFSPDNPNVAYLVANKGLYRSEDGGETWCLLDVGTRRLSATDELTLDPSNPNRIYVGTEKKIMVSDDSGCHFRVIFDWDRYFKKNVNVKQ